MKRFFNVIILVVFVFALVSCATKKWTNVSGNVNLAGNPLFSKSEFIKSGNGYILKLYLNNED